MHDSARCGKPSRISRVRGWRPSRSTPISIAALLGLVCVSATAAVTIFDLTPIVVRSDSMAPELNRGDLAIARSASAGDVTVGDVISVKDRAGVRVTHRVVTVDPFGSSIQFTLKGDANAVPDAQVYEVHDADGTVIGLFVMDFWCRPTKQGGAWMSNLVDQSLRDGTLPVVTNNCNYSPSTTTISWDD